jgi:glutathione S-transferase
MQLYGTVTSPFVRRVRVVAHELAIPVDRIDTATDVGQAQLLAITPIRKVPVAQIDERTLFDSRVIVDWLTTTRGYGTLAPPIDVWRQHNIINAIDSAVDAAITLFYLKRDGVAAEGSQYQRRQLARIAAIFDWLGAQVASDGSHFGDSAAGNLGLSEISLICILDWMDFRNTYPTSTAPALVQLRTAWHRRASLLATHPSA